MGFQKSTLTRDDRVITRDIAGERLLVPIRGKLADMQRLFALNPAGAFIWDQLDGETSAEAISERVAAAFDVQRDAARADVAEFLDQLVVAGVVRPVEA